MEGYHHKIKKSQSSLEYMLVIAITFAIIVPTTYLFYSYSKGSSEEIKDSQIINIGNIIIDTAQTIFYSGQGSKATLELNVPDNIESATIIDSRELVFKLITSVGVSDIVFFSTSVKLTTSGCTISICEIPKLGSSGLKKVKLEVISQDSVRIEVI